MEGDPDDRQATPRTEVISLSSSKAALCPSARCDEGALLFGVVQATGAVSLLAEPLEVDQDFVAAARQGRAPEARFRFAAPCQCSACPNWQAQRCTVIDDVLLELGDQTLAEQTLAGQALPTCSLRPRCRWYEQLGASACAACPLVITDTTAGARV